MQSLMPMNRIFFYEPKTERHGSLLGTTHNPEQELAKLMSTLAKREATILMLLFIGQPPRAIAVGQGSEQYSQLDLEVVNVQGVDTIIKIHWVDIEKRTVWLLDNRWGFPANCTLPKGTKLVAKSKIHWSDMQHNYLYLESAATKFLGVGVLIELNEDTPMIKTSKDFDRYEATSFQQLERLYEHAVPYEFFDPPKLGPNNFDFKPDPKPYGDFDNNFDREYMMFILSHATEEQLRTHSYQFELGQFGIVLNPEPELRVVEK